ncbi:MAG: membrane dipeptidase [Rhizobiaceae bacterium]|nr:membrane dipeptidase [Rhizobiaceae bacterium]
MKRILKYGAGLLALLAAVGAAVFFLVLPDYVADTFNEVLVDPPYQVSDDAAALHETLTVADLHADPLLWGRDLLERTDYGQVDVPRLIEGNVALQVFSVVSKTPSGLNIEANDDDSDNVTLLAIGQLWPIRTWTNLKERALYQAERLRDMAERSNGQLVIIRTRGDLESFLERRKTEPGIVAGLLALEGAHVLEGDPANVDVMFQAGYRMMSATHFFDNEMAGSAHGLEKGGLTDAGRVMVKRMEELGMIVDIAHGSAAQIDNVLAMATKPVVVSHTGVKGTCDNNRNLSGEQLQAIAANGGLIGIGYWDTAICGTDAAAIAKAQRHVADLIGAEHLALGSDFDGAVATPFDTTGLALITEAMLEQDFSEAEIRQAMGGNQIRVLLETLPE